MELISLILSAGLDTVQDVAPLVGLVLFFQITVPRRRLADPGGVTTSTVTVPLVAALGLGLAANVPGRSPLFDGFGPIAFASVFPIIAVLGYAQLSSALESAQKRRRRRGRA